MGVSISIVSHGHASYLNRCLLSLDGCSEVEQILITINIPDESIIVPSGLNSIVTKIENYQPKGFAENHNRAFTYSKSEYFVVLNPDTIITTKTIFEDLIKQCRKIGGGIVAPALKNLDGSMQLSARSFPTIRSLCARVLFSFFFSPKVDTTPRVVDFLSGAFLLFDSKTYRELEGFDEGYFLYYEDVDICSRAHKNGYNVYYFSQSSAYHAGQYKNWKNFKYFRYHLKSLIRYFRTHHQNIL